MNPTLLISGATGGLGSAFAIECARRGYDLLLTDLGADGADFAGYLSTTFQVQAQYKPCDLTSLESRNLFYQELRLEQRSFWGLVNVAGTDYEGPFLERSRQEILTVLRLNVEATVDTTYTILKMRDRRRRFMLINVCSLAAYQPMPFKAVYAATKRLLLDFTLSIGEEIRSFGTATALCPAGMPTTPETMRAIFAQGFWGVMTSTGTRRVARRTIDHALKGRRVYVPGALNGLLAGISSLAPTALKLDYVGRRWKSAQETGYPPECSCNALPSNLTWSKPQ